MKDYNSWKVGVKAWYLVMLVSCKHANCENNFDMFRGASKEWHARENVEKHPLDTSRSCNWKIVSVMEFQDEEFEKLLYYTKIIE